MDKLTNSSQFLDLAGLDDLRAQALREPDKALKGVTKQFESIFIQMLMKSMRSANDVFAKDNPLNSESTQFYQQLHDQQMAVDLSDKGVLGLAELMEQQLSAPKPAKAVDPQTGARELTMPTYRPQSSTASTSAVGGQDGGNTLPLSFPPTSPSAPSLVLAREKNSQEASFSFASADEFISRLYPYAKKAADKLGTEPEVLLAQSALETGWGQKIIHNADGKPSNNLFNIKANNAWSGDKVQVNTLEFEQGVAVKKNANFRAYEDMEQSFNDFVDFISDNQRYQDALKVAPKPAEFIQALQDAGFATDPQYAQKIIKVMGSVTQMTQGIGSSD